MQTRSMYVITASVMANTITQYLTWEGRSEGGCDRGTIRIVWHTGRTGNETMISRLFNLLFGCSHKRTSRPVTPSKKSGQPQDTYVVCLECGKHLAYDLKKMQMGKVLE